jgi:hypothetical protein
LPSVLTANQRSNHRCTKSLLLFLCEEIEFAAKMSTAEETKGDTTQDQNDEWIVQSKPRRLVPQHSLSRQDLEADKAKAAASSTAAGADTKKKGKFRDRNM